MKKILRNTLYTMTAMSMTLGVGQAMAMDTFMMNSRAAGMGGAGIACTTDANAQYYNPAAFGFFSKKPAVDEGEEQPKISGLAEKDWGIDVNVGAGARIHGEIGEYMETLADVDFEELSNNGIENEEDVRSLLSIAKSLSGIDDKNNAFSAQLAGNVAARVGHVAVGVYGMAQVSGQVFDLDTTNLGLSAVDSADLSADIEAANASSSSPVDTASYTNILFTGALYDQLIATGLTAEAVQILDSMAVSEGVTADQVAQVSEILANVTDGSTSGSVTTLDDNTTTIIAEGFGVVEVPISYGYAINNNISIGGNIKYMKGRVYGTSIRVFDDNNDEVLDDIDSRYNETSTFGIDMGVMGRFGKFQFGLVGRNLNSPEFDGFNDITTSGAPHIVDDVKIKPQVAAGIAVMPFETLTLALDLDLTSNETTINDYKTQYVRCGLEWDAFKVVALRVGAYSNLSESDIGMVYTAGLGLNLWAARLDVSGAYASDTVDFDGDEVPTEVYVMARLAVDF